MAAFWVPWSRGELNLNTSATQLIWEPTLRDTSRVGRKAATCCSCQPENDGAGGGTASTELWDSEVDYLIHCKFYGIGFKTVSSCGERGHLDDGVPLEPKHKIPSRCYFTDTAIPTLHSETKTEVLEALIKAGR